MRRPKNIADYEPAENIAAHFEALAQDIRREEPGTLMKISVQLWWWKPKWDAKPKTTVPASSPTREP